jgi:hypothetical protein
LSHELTAALGVSFRRTGPPRSAVPLASTAALSSSGRAEGAVALIAWQPSALEAINRMVNEAVVFGDDWIFLHRADLQVEPSAIQSLLRVARGHAGTLGLVAAAITQYAESGGVARYSGGYWWDTAQLSWRREIGYAALPDATELVVQVHNIAMGAWLISSKAWLRVGGFDPRMDRAADLDWSIRSERLGFAGLMVWIQGCPFGREDAGATMADLPAQDALRLALRHNGALFALILAARRIGCSTAAELSKVSFSTDYGIDIGFGKRMFWYTIGLLRAATRPAIRAEFAALRGLVVGGLR